MRFVPIKTLDHQGVLSLHRVRSLFVRQRTASINSVRGLLTEFGIVAGKGIQRVAELRQRMDKVGDALLAAEARAAVAEAFDHIDALTRRIDAIEARIITWHKSSEASHRLASAPGWGRSPPVRSSPVSATGNSSRRVTSQLGLA